MNMIDELFYVMVGSCCYYGVLPIYRPGVAFNLMPFCVSATLLPVTLPFTVLPCYSCYSCYRWWYVAIPLLIHLLPDTEPVTGTPGARVTLLRYVPAALPAHSVIHRCRCAPLLPCEPCL